jgi:hypothetical protein
MTQSNGRLYSSCLILAACGADNIVAPDAPPARVACQSLSQMAPAFMNILDNEQRSPQLKYVVQNYLLEPERSGGEPPVVSLLRIVFGTINRFVNDSPEPGGNPCNDANPPAPASANRVCELRRMLDIFVHQGKGLEALRLIDPVIYNVFGYMNGQPGLATAKHYEIADFLSRSCGSPGLCKPQSTFDLLANILAYLRPPRGKAALDAINTLWANPYLTGPNGFLTKLDVQGQLGEDGFVLLGKFLMREILQMPRDATYFDNIKSVLDKFVYKAINDTSQPGLRAQLDAAVAIVKDMLDPTRDAPILQPLHDVVYCFSEIDRNYFNDRGDLLRMLY